MPFKAVDAALIPGQGTKIPCVCSVCVCVCVCVSTHELCLTLCEFIDCSPPDFSVHEIFQTRILEQVAISYSRGSSQPKYRTLMS